MSYCLSLHGFNTILIEIPYNCNRCISILRKIKHLYFRRKLVSIIYLKAPATYLYTLFKDTILCFYVSHFCLREVSYYRDIHLPRTSPSFCPCWLTFLHLQSSSWIQNSQRFVHWLIVTYRYLLCSKTGSFHYCICFVLCGILDLYC